VRCSYKLIPESAKADTTVAQAVAGLLPKRIRKRAEKSGKLGPQVVESNEINMMVKTLNQ
jgi:hypothetical protein